MIKRRFYKLDHGDKDANSDSSSSSDSEAEIEQRALEQSEDDRENCGVDEEGKVGSSSSSGYESEDSSVNEVGFDYSGLPLSDDDAETVSHGIDNPVAAGDNDAKQEPPLADDEDLISPVALEYVISCKSVFKCKICPRIVCLSKETLKAHLESKRHARSEKLLSEGRLKAMLNSDGNIVNQETAAEAHARVMASAPEHKIQKRKNRGRQRQRMRAKKLKGSESAEGNSARSMQVPAKKRHR